MYYICIPYINIYHTSYIYIMHYIPHGLLGPLILYIIVSISIYLSLSVYIHYGFWAPEDSGPSAPCDLGAGRSAGRSGSPPSAAAGHGRAARPAALAKVHGEACHVMYTLYIYMYVYIYIYIHM